MFRILSIFFTIVLVLFGLAVIRDGVGYVLDDRDWAEDYITAEATIAASQERKWGRDTRALNTAGPNPSSSYSCSYLLDFDHDGERYRKTAVWLNEVYPDSRGADCGAARYGQTVTVWVVDGYNDSEPTMLRVGDRNEKPLTIGFTFLIGLASLFAAYLLGKRTWRRWRSRT